MRAISRSWSVTPPSAETTTATPLSPSASRTSPAATLMRSWSRTEVPPNFMTLMALGPAGSRTTRGPERMGGGMLTGRESKCLLYDHLDVHGHDRPAVVPVG